MPNGFNWHEYFVSTEKKNTRETIPTGQLRNEETFMNNFTEPALCLSRSNDLFKYRVGKWYLPIVGIFFSPLLRTLTLEYYIHWYFFLKSPKIKMTISNNVERISNNTKILFKWKSVQETRTNLDHNLLYYQYTLHNSNFFWQILVYLQIIHIVFIWFILTIVS